jgi:predicted nucleic acid-binding protein
MKVFLDTNVVLDGILPGRTFEKESEAIMAMGEEDEILLRIASISLPTIVYCTRKDLSRDEILERIKNINRHWNVLSVGFGEIYSALHSSCPDFEDALQIATAEVDSDVIITGDVKHFKPYTSLPVFTPAGFLDELRRHSA